MDNIGMMNIGVGLNTKKFETGIKMINNQVRSLNESFMDIADSSMEIGQKLAKNVVLPLALIGGASTKVAADFETMKISLEGLTGSTENATKLFETMKQFSATTPFQLNDIVKAGQTMLGMSYSTENLLLNLRMLGDVAAGANVPLTEIAKIMGKIRAKGKASMEEINQLVERQIPLMDELIKTYKDAPSFFTALRKGKVSFNDVNTAIKNMTSESGMFFNQTIKQSKTLNGKLSTLYDNIKNTVALLGDQLMPIIKPILDTAISILELVQKIPTKLIAVLAVVSSIGFAFAAVGSAVLVFVGMLGFMFGESYKTYKIITQMIPILFTGAGAIKLQGKEYKLNYETLLKIKKLNQQNALAGTKAILVEKIKQRYEKSRVKTLMRFISTDEKNIKIQKLKLKYDKQIRKIEVLSEVGNNKLLMLHNDIAKKNVSAISAAGSLNRIFGKLLIKTKAIGVAMMAWSGISGLPAQISKITFSMKGLSAAIGAVRIATMGLLTVFAKIALPIIAIYTIVSSINGEWLSMNEILWMILTPIAQIVSLLEYIVYGIFAVLSGVVSGIVWAFYGLLQAVDGIAIGIFNMIGYLKTVGNIIIATVGPAFDWLWSNLKIIGNNIGIAFGAMGGVIKNGFIEFFNWFETKMGYLVGKLDYVVARLKAAFSGNFSGSGITDYTEELVKTIKEKQTKPEDLQTPEYQSLAKIAPADYSGFKSHEWDSTSPLKGLLDGTKDAAKGIYNNGIKQFDDITRGEGIGAGIQKFADSLLDTEKPKDPIAKSKNDKKDSEGKVKKETKFGEMMFTGALSTYENELKIKGATVDSKVDTAAINTEKHTKSIAKNIKKINNKTKEVNLGK